MKVAVGFLLVGMIVLGLLLCQSAVRLAQTTIDLHVHDTYFVISYVVFVPLVLLALLALFALGGVIGTRCKNRYFLVTFLIALALNGWLYWHFFSSIKSA
jgi:heme/copper-type cytochrome/quinol oxidase subunit 1